MTRTYTLTPEGTLETNEWNAVFDSNEREGDIFSTDHISSFALNDDLHLLADTFNTSMEIVPQRIRDAVLGDQRLLAHECFCHFKDRFAVEPQRLKERYRQDIETKKKNRAPTYIICPTYDCNNRCVYCYQQYSDSIDRKTISDDNLKKIFSFIENDASRLDEGRPVSVQVFGGEPFQKHLRPVIRKILEFCRHKRFSLGATTNGVELDEFLDLIITYRGYFSKIGTTLDGDSVLHDKRRRYIHGGPNHARIVDNINKLLKIGIHVIVQTNYDRQNIDELSKFLETVYENGWHDNPLMELEIGRVDDRKYESSYNAIMPEAELLHHLMRYDNIHRLPGNLKIAFLKSSYDFAKMLGVDFGQHEGGRARFHYCWTSSPVDDVIYIDPDLDVYRCTYSVGEKSLKLGKLDDYRKSLKKLTEHNTFNNEACMKCRIGGICGGGCCISWDKNKERQCREEKKNFEYFMNNIAVPKVQGMLNSLTT